MKKRIYHFVSILLLSILFTACSDETTSDYSGNQPVETNKTYALVIYGSDNCGHTSLFRTECVKRNILFTYLNISGNKANETLLWNVVKQNPNIGTRDTLSNGSVHLSVLLPVIELSVDKQHYALERPGIMLIDSLIH